MVHDQQPSFSNARVSLKYRRTSKLQQLAMEKLGTTQDIDNKLATHVVTAVLYGAEAFFVFDREILENENYRGIHSKMETLVKALPKVSASASSLKDEDQKAADSFHCTFYGDLVPDTNPFTYKDAIAVISELPKHFSEQEKNLVTVQAWLYPLSKLNLKATTCTLKEISSALVKQIQQCNEAFNRFEIRSNGLIKTNVYNCFPHLKMQASQFLEIINEHKTNFMDQMSTMIPQVRSGEIKEKELDEFLGNLRKSPLSENSLDSWLKGKEDELKVLIPIIDSIKGVKGIEMAFEPGDLDSAMTDMNYDHVLSFKFIISDKNDIDALQRMSSFLYTKQLETDSHNATSSGWYKSGAVKDVRTKVKFFTVFAEANYKEKKVKFVVTSEDNDDRDAASTKSSAKAIIEHHAHGVLTGEFEPPSKPLNFNQIKVQERSVQLQWKAPQDGVKSIQCYTIYYRSFNELAGTWMMQQTKGNEEVITIDDLIPNTKYLFKVCAESEAGHSEHSDPITVEAKSALNEQLKNITSNSTIISAHSPRICKIKTQNVTPRWSQHNIAKMEVGGRPHPPKPTKVLMVVGATGAGKSTLINAMVNYFFGVKWEFEFRLKLIHDETSQSQTHSQTQSISAYTLNWYKESPLDCNLMIIDTPGFGDTRGIERDQEITALIRDFFKMRGGIDELHAIGFVTQSSLARLTHTQKYIFDSILAIFGKDIKDSIFVMTTFADGADPPVMQAVKEAKVPHCCSFPFNNSALFADSSAMSKFSRMFWDMGYASMDDFFVRFEQAPSVSLQLTREVLDERHQLETIVCGIQPQIDVGLAKMDELNQEERILRANESDILANKDFTYEVKVTKQRKIMAPKGTYVTTCAECHYTCHKSCAFADDRDKYMCSAMNGGGESNATCTVCPGECHWRKHFNNGYLFETYEEIETRTSQELLDRYKEAESAKANVQAVITTMEEELQEIQDGVLYNIRQARKCLQRLDEIALKPNPMTEVEYIDLLIRSEEQQKDPGWKIRVEYLQKVRQQAEILSKVKDSKELEKTPQQSKSWWKKFTYGVRDLVVGNN